MKKFFVLAAAAALTLASCAKVETISNVNDEEHIIGFSNYAPKALAKADTDNYVSSTTLKDGADFDVYGWYTDNGTAFTATAAQLEKQFMNWYTVTYKTGGSTDGNGKTNLYPDGYRYWPTGSTPDYLSFFAYYPSNAGTITPPTKGLGNFSFTAENAAADQVDFMVSEVVADQTYSTANGNPGTNNSVDGEVHLTFNHMLTKVKFQFKTTADVADAAKSRIEVYLKDAKLKKINNTGTLTASFDGTSTSTIWGSVSGDATYEIFINNADINNQLLTDDASDAESKEADLFLMVPQDMVAATQAIDLVWDVKDLVTGKTTENTATVYFKTDLKDGDDPETANALEIDWDPNMFVIYTITIGPKPILFTAEATNWDSQTLGFFNVN